MNNLYYFKVLHLIETRGALPKGLVYYPGSWFIIFCLFQNKSLQQKPEAASAAMIALRMIALSSAAYDSNLGFAFT